VTLSSTASNGESSATNLDTLCKVGESGAGSVLNIKNEEKQDPKVKK
jgi:hypothetical protein